MADPFSVAGSAVGVASLGILICQGLVIYIGDVKDDKERTAQVLRQIDELASHLERLISILSKMEPNPHTLGAKQGIVVCAEAINKIKDKLGWELNGARSTCRMQWKDPKKRLGYTLKKADIAHVRGVVEFIEQNLHTALLALML